MSCKKREKNYVNILLYHKNLLKKAIKYCFFPARDNKQQLKTSLLVEYVSSFQDQKYRIMLAADMQNYNSVTKKREM